MNNFVAFCTVPAFACHRPRSLQEAMERLRDLGERGRMIAGGTDLLPALRQGKLDLGEPSAVVDLSTVPGLKGIARDSEWVEIGAATSLTEVLESAAVRESVPILAHASAQVGSLQIRNRGTLGGNLCNASPAADTAVALLALNARVFLESVDQKRILSLDEFFVGPGKTVLKPGEILTKIQVPIPPSTQSGCFLKLGRRSAFTLSIVSVAVAVQLRDAAFRSVRIALGAVAPTPIRARRAEECLLAKRAEASVIEEASAMAAGAASPVSDVRASAVYRKDMCRVLTRRALRSCLNSPPAP